MLVQCPKCKTTYKVSDEVIKGAAAAFRCSRCKHTFEIQLTAEGAPQPPIQSGSVNKSSELAFTFQPAGPGEPDVARSDASPDAEPTAAPVKFANPLVSGRAAEAASNTSHAARFPEVRSQSRITKEAADAAEPPREGIDKVLNIAPYREQRASVMPFLSLFGLLVLLSVFVWAYQRNYPAASEGWLASIPLLGPSVVRNDHLKNGVLLKSIETKFQVLQGNREAVVLTGVAVNQNPIMIRNVQLSAQLFDHDGKEIERQTMWIGNAISSQIIRGMTAQDVIDLQRLKPLKTFEIPPGDSVAFAIVFLRPGKSLKDARCEVLSVEAV
jgi:predicted Zn finger-like uncharacterized protein